jgi:hypothetical protein
MARPTLTALPPAVGGGTEVELGIVTPPEVPGIEVKLVSVVFSPGLTGTSGPELVTEGPFVVSGTELVMTGLSVVAVSWPSLTEVC